MWNCISALVFRSMKQRRKTQGRRSAANHHVYSSHVEIIKVYLGFKTFGIFNLLDIPVRES
jgi:hypothetical protein